VNWADLVIGAILLAGAYKGFKTGIINELMGILALVCSVWAGFAYGGFWDESIATSTHVGPGSSHALGLLAFSAEVYAIVSLIGFFLSRIASLPLIKIGNKVLGACVGLGKTSAFIWAVLYIALFFPLTEDLRRDLHQSTLASTMTQPYLHLDGSLHDSLPDFAKLFAAPYFERHHV
jgi:uncharacterized membrane protein required for colicin V production